MARTTSETIYRDVGAYYDKLWSPVRGGWHPVFRRLVRPILPGVESVCELGCGTGNRALEFARRGFRVFAVDLSRTMLRTARQKARQAGLPIRFIWGDMRAFRLPQQVDLVTSEWGVINHVPRKADLVRVVGAVGRALRPGGYFMFDVNHRLTFERYWVMPEVQQTPELFVVQQGGYDPRRDKGWMEVTWFAAGRNGLWKRYHQSIEEVHWTRSEVRRSLLRAGFERVRACDFNVLLSSSKVPHKLRGLRTVFLARWKRPAPSVTGRP